MILYEMTHMGVVIQDIQLRCVDLSRGEASEHCECSAGMSSAYYSYPDASDEECIKVIHRALELGINHLDTSDAYGPHTNERLVGGVSPALLPSAPLMMTLQYACHCKV